MSGIAAIFKPQSSNANESLIRDMASLMAIRGPNYQQYWCDKNMAMTHTLLPTTIESKNECQPSTTNGDIWITADARIDARDDLISKLKRHFPNIKKNTTDDKLILSAYQLWGAECLDHIIGDFAFILWDSTKQRLLAATDQFGVTPLYYAKTEMGICISNTLNAIRLHPEVSNELDQVAIADYLLFRINENNHGTFFEHIKHLPAGHFLTFENNTLRIKQYWKFEPRGEIIHSKPSGYIEEFNDLLKCAVRDRLRTNSAAVHLSGGMDSSSVTAIANNLSKDQSPLHKITAYTYGASGGLPDLEAPFAHDIANELDIEHHVFSGSENELKKMDTPLHLRSPEPRFTTRENTNYRILEHTSNHSSVLMTGFGGDPLLRSQGLRIDDFSSPKKALNMLKQVKLHLDLFGKRPQLGLRAQSKLSRESNRPIPNWIKTEFAEEHKLEKRFNSIIRQKSSSERAQESMTHGGLWRRIFCWNDPGFTHIPVKVVHPFFDTRLLEFSQNLPPFPWLHNKTILRQSMQADLPKKVTERPKTALPGNGLQAILLSGYDASYYHDLLSNPKLSDFIDPEPLKKALMDASNSHKNNFKSIIRVATLSDWLNGCSTSPTTFSNNGNKNHVKRIKY